MLRFKYSNILHKMQIKTEKNFYYCVIEYIFAKPNKNYNFSKTFVFRNYLECEVFDISVSLY